MSKSSQNPNHKQFDKVEDITKLYLKSPDSQYAIYPAMLVNPWTYAQHYRYMKLKDELKDGKLKEGGLKDMLGAGSILMANERGKRIDIQNYLIWLRCSYKIHLTSDEPYEEKPNLTEQQLCSGNPLQTYIQK